MKKQKRRSKVKNAALNPKFNARVRQENIDFDYLDKLNEQELAWLNKFMSEYNNAEIRENDPNLLHDYETHKKEIFDRNNARNRDLYGLVKNKVGNTKIVNYDDMLNIVEEELSKDVNPANVENAYVDFLDHIQVNKIMMEEYEAAMASFREDLG